MGDLERFVAVAEQLYAQIPDPLLPIVAGHRIALGAWSVESVVKTYGKMARSVQGWARALESGDLWGYLGQKKPMDLQPARVAIAQLLLGQVAEQAFEKVFRERLGAAATRYQIRDHRESRD